MLLFGLIINQLGRTRIHFILLHRRYKTKRRMRLASEMFAAATFRKYPLLTHHPLTSTKELTGYVQKFLLPSAGKTKISLLLKNLFVERKKREKPLKTLSSGLWSRRDPIKRQRHIT